MTEKSGADILIEALCDLGVEVVFGYPGGAVLPIYDALFRSGRIKHILVPTNRPRRMQPRAMPARPASPAWCSSPRGLALPTRSPGSPMR